MADGAKAEKGMDSNMMAWFSIKSIALMALALVGAFWLFAAWGRKSPGRYRTIARVGGSEALKKVLIKEARAEDHKAISAFAAISGDQNKRAVAIRVAFRAFGGLPSIDDGAWSISTELAPKIKLHALRALFISWVSDVYEGVRPTAKAESFKALLPLLSELDAAMPDFYKRNIMSSDYAVGAWQQNVEAGRRSAALVEAIHKLKLETQPFDVDRSYNTLWDSYSPFGPDGRFERDAWRVVSQQALEMDCRLLKRGAATRRSLLLMPLWHDPKSAATETNVLPISKGWPQYIDLWLRERKDGSLVMGKEPEVSAELMVRIANLPASFWESREPEKVLKAFDYCLLGYLDNPNWGSETRDF